MDKTIESTSKITIESALRIEIESTWEKEPQTVEELAAAVQACAARSATMLPTGGGTKLGWGHRIAPEVRISTAGLAGVREHTWQDLTATVGAGTTWAAMQAALARHGQRVAADPLFAERATVGGVLATNDCGLLRMRYGGLRDLVLGMTLVLADGTIARTGGKVVKNVAGYDLPKLLTGSFGTLGIIAEVTFRLHPVAAQEERFTLRALDVAALAEVMGAVVRSGMSVETMALRNESLAFALEVAFAAVPEALADHADRLRHLVATAPGAVTLERADDSGWGLWRDALFARPEATVLKVTALPQKLAALMAGVAQLDQTPQVTARAVADPVGVVTVALEAEPAGLAMVVEDLRSRLASVGGSVAVLERGRLPEEVDAWCGPEQMPSALDVMRAIKQEFDPARLLSPGRFVGGL